MLDLLKYFQEDKNTYSAQQIVLYNFDEQQSAHFIQDVLVPFREAFISNEKIVQMIDKYNETRPNIIKEHIPSVPDVMSGDFGEILSYYIAQCFFANDANVAPMKWRYKDDPDKASPKTDIVLCYIQDESNPSSNDKLYSIEVKTHATSPGSDSSIYKAVCDADKDRTSRLAETIPYLLKRMKDTDESPDVYKKVERFKDPYSNPYLKSHNAVAVVDSSDLQKHIDNIPQGILQQYKGIDIYCIPMARLKDIYSSVYDNMPLQS